MRLLGKYWLSNDNDISSGRKVALGKSAHISGTGGSYKSKNPWNKCFDTVFTKFLKFKAAKQENSTFSHWVWIFLCSLEILPSSGRTRLLSKVSLPARPKDVRKRSARTVRAHRGGRMEQGIEACSLSPARTSPHTQSARSGAQGILWTYDCLFHTKRARKEVGRGAAAWIWKGLMRSINQI